MFNRNVSGSWTYVGENMFLQDFKPFMLISLSTLLIAAAGYIINDYFDLKIDLINRPTKMVLEQKIPMRTAIIAHTVLNIAGLALAFIVARGMHHYELLAIQVICSILLWFYSTHFKKQFITGNVVVAFLTALTIIMLAAYSPITYLFLTLPSTVNNSLGYTYINPLLMCLGYAVFAFMLTWMREIVKDMEDYKGDAAEGCMTMPIKKGLQFSARFAQLLGAITIIALAIISYFFFTDSYLILGIYTIALIVAPLIWWCVYIAKKNTIEHYASASKWLKIIMLSGIASLIVYHFSIDLINCYGA